MSNEFEGVEREVLDQLQYAVPRKGGSFRLYIFGKDGLHSGGQWFCRKPKFLDEEITVSAAEIRADRAIREGKEVRVTDAGDMLVYHFKNGKRLYPAGIENVWQAL